MGLIKESDLSSCLTCREEYLITDSTSIMPNTFCSKKCAKIELKREKEAMNKKKEKKRYSYFYSYLTSNGHGSCHADTNYKIRTIEAKRRMEREHTNEHGMEITIMWYKELKGDK